MRYEGSLSVEEARGRYFEVNGFGANGGYDETWVKLKLGFIPIFIPNTEARRKAVRLHDLHHVATEYETTWTGEAEIGAWEVGAGCGNYWAAWVLNLSAMAYGIFIAPRRVLAAFRRGRRSRTLYQFPWSDDLLKASVQDLRRKLVLE